MDTRMLATTVWLAVDPIKYCLMVNAVALLATTQSMVSADNVIGTKFMMRVSESVESHAMIKESTTSKLKAASAYLSTSKWLMEPALPAHFTPPTTQ